MTPTSTEREVVISVQGLSARYGNTLVLENVNLDVYRGEILTILGASGCGKSTLLKQMVGLHAPAAGRVVVLGHDLAALDEEGLEALRRRMGVLFQGGALFGSMTVEENIALPLSEHLGMDIKLAKRIARIKLALVQLEHAAERFPGELSGGMRKRAALARAIALDPEILFFDEPSAGLDPLTSAGLDELILRLNRLLGITIVVVTHELQSIFAISQRAVMLAMGGVVAQGTIDELRSSTNPHVKQFIHRKAPEPVTPRLSWLEQCMALK